MTGPEQKKPARKKSARKRSAKKKAASKPQVAAGSLPPKKLAQAIYLTQELINEAGNYLALIHQKLETLHRDLDNAKANNLKVNVPCDPNTGIPTGRITVRALGMTFEPERGDDEPGSYPVAPPPIPTEGQSDIPDRGPTLAQSLGLAPPGSEVDDEDASTS